MNDGAAPTRKPAPTLEMVASHAKVSRATVSRVVNGTPTVDPVIAEKVRRSIDELNYVPNRAARSLASNRSQAIALVVPESATRIFSDPFFASVVQGVASVLNRTEYTLNMIIESETNAAKTQRYLRGGDVDGALVVSHHVGDHSYTELGLSLPVVFGGRPVDDRPDTIAIDVDNLDGARTAVRHLVVRGARRIATIAGPQDMRPGVDRLVGWRDELAAAGLEPGPVQFGDFSPSSGAEAAHRLLASGEDFDAIFAANDQMAAGAVPVLREAGLTVPEDVAIVGYDDSVFSATMDPPLTTMHQPMVEMGAAMATALTTLMEGGTVEPLTLLRASLVVRASA